MSHFQIEIFGHIAYSPDLTYHDLLVREEEAKQTVQGVLEKAGAEFIHFEALGDTLRFQCMLLEEKDDVFHAICDDLAPYVNNGLDARMLMVDKDLGCCYYYSLAKGKWQEGAIALPPPGYLTQSTVTVVRHVATNRPQGAIPPSMPNKAQTGEILAEGKVQTEGKNLTFDRPAETGKVSSENKPSANGKSKINKAK